MRAVFKSFKTLRGHLCRVKGKQPLDRTKGVIYNIPCTCGREYIGDTGRNLRVGIGNMSNAIAVHVHETDHPIDWDCKGNREGKTLHVGKSRNLFT